MPSLNVSSDSVEMLQRARQDEQRALEKIEQKKIGVVSKCCVCYVRDINPDVCGELGEESKLRRLRCLHPVCVSCAMMLLRDVSGVGSGVVALPCPLCRKFSFLETNTVFLHPSKRSAAERATWRDNGMTTRVLFDDTGVADTRRPIVICGEQGDDVETTPGPDFPEYDGDDMDCTRTPTNVLMRLRRLMVVQNALEKAVV